MMSGSGIRRSKGREVVAQTGMAQLRHPHRARDITQRMRAEIGQPSIGGELVFDHLLAGTRQDRLASMRQVAQPGGLIDRGPA